MKGETTNQKARPPVVVIMGHVDHGKTTLLDYIRKANVAAREAGGITQAVGAYEIEHAVPGAPARKITFIDTPGHEAFTKMRSRGASIADLAILVVAADEGVKPQTKEAIQIIIDSKTPYIVAFNKIDKLSDGGAGGGLEKAKTELMTAGVMLEGYGGQVSYHGISAKTGEGVNELLDLVLLSADVEHLTTDPGAAGSGFVLEAKRDPRRGIEASIIIKDGTLKRGDEIKSRGIDGKIVSGKIKILENFLGKTVDTLAASSPAAIIGFEDIPTVGEIFATGAGAEAALGGAEKPGAAAKAAADAVALAAAKADEVPPSAAQTARAKRNTLNLLLKASDAGSLEALMRVLSQIPRPEGKEIRIVESGVGDITDGDVKHAMATLATIIGFKNKVEKGAQTLAEAQSVQIIISKIVYDLEKVVAEFLLGTAGPAAASKLEVLAVFNQDKLDKQLVGGKITMGTFREKTSCDILRGGAGGESVGMGRVLNLREKKAEIAQAEEGKEIGVLISAQTAVQVGDILIIRK